MRNYPAFPRATPHQWAGSPRVPHPSATLTPEGATFDLHALGTPPALILSQDQTLHQNCRLPSRMLRQDFVSHCACVVLRCACSPPAPRKNPARPARRSSIFGRPMTIPPVPLPQGSKRAPTQPSQPNPRRPTCQCAALSSAHEQKKTALFGRAALSLDAFASRLRSSSTIYKATPSGHSLAPDSARVSTC